jgi:hypothetical protein
MWNLPGKSVDKLEKEIAKARKKIETIKSVSVGKFADLDQAALAQANETDALQTGEIYLIEEKIRHFGYDVAELERSQKAEKQTLKVEQEKLNKINHGDLDSAISADNTFLVSSKYNVYDAYAIEKKQLD